MITKDQFIQAVENSKNIMKFIKVISLHSLI